VFDHASLPIQEKIRLLALAAARKRTGVLNPNSEQERKERKLWIEKCRTDLTSWSVEGQKDRGFKPAAHHRLLISYLEKVASGDTKRLMVFMPPGSAKSTYASHLFPAWMFERRRNLRIIGASHTTDLALDFSGKIQQFIVENEDVLTYKLRTEQKQRWYTTNGGSYLAAGVGTAIPGFRADIGIIDDPVKSRDAADSEGDRQKVWQWYLGSFERRLTPGAAVILILTRWHEDDLAGRLLEVQGDKWEMISLPAEAEEYDQLGREPGDWLWNDDDWGYGAELEEIKTRLEEAGASREWSSQYQQHPRPLDGSIFKTMMVSKLLAAPVGDTVRAWDLGATRDTGSRDPSWTRGVKLTRTDMGRFVVSDVASIRGTPDEVERVILNTSNQDGRRVRIGMPQDPGQAGKAQAAYYAKKLAGFILEISPETGDKATRASPVASQVNIGNLDIVDGKWNKPFLDELAAFPSGAHEDQVDALSRGFSMLIEDHSAFILSPQIRANLAGMGRNRLGRVRI
jgi:predicted phage terminase large subunit-like protein